jgi:hypothetical protein
MKPNISEFSYGYALTDELMHSPGSSIQGVPIFPSLYQEGQLGGGYDVRLNRPGVPLFLQFKLSDRMKSRGCREHGHGTLTIPCYRMSLRPSRHSDQHALLLELEGKGNEVYYSAPAFHEPQELDAAYLNAQVRQRSMWIRPHAIGPLPDDKDHHVSFNQPGSQWFRFSTPVELRDANTYESFETHVRERLLHEGKRSAADSMERVAEHLVEILEIRKDFERQDRAILRDKLAAADSLTRAAYLSATFLECALFVMQSKVVDAG